jgi:GTP diphosphokinase / guanosine-3',5'-bis(diphosphate) 3'-diphosphatase
MSYIKTTKIDLNKLIEEIKEYNPNADLDLIEKAFNFTKEAHKGAKRKSGEDFLVHPFVTARILVRLKADSATICAALLHDVIEDTKFTEKDLEEAFNKEIVELVISLTKIDNIKFESKEDYNAENLRKILLATAKDIRVILIKLADRLHNMRTLQHFREEKRKRIAKQTMDIYAPIAHKLGIGFLKGELEDLAFRFLEPEAYSFLANKIKDKREERESNTKKIIALIKSKLEQKTVPCKIIGRAKYFYSIFKKMQEKNKDFNEIYDLIGLRILVSTIPECYTALGTVHELFKPMPGRFKDYIAVPKSNGYQSLHTSVMSPHGKVIEIQIRTQQMHNAAEEGVASHWRYKKTERDKQFDRKISWLRQLLDWKTSSKNAINFIETFKIDLFQNEIVTFTPKGDPISVPENSTPIDFAFQVHTNVGLTCSKAEVNGKIAPLDSNLKSGDVINIITKKNSKPSRNWLTFVKTSKARTKIRNYLNIEHEHNPKLLREKKDIPNLLSSIQIKEKINNVKISKCCNPQINEPIVAYHTKDGKVTIHKKDCSNIHSLENTKSIPVSWINKDESKFNFRIVVKDRVGMLAEILNLFTKEKINIYSLHTKNKKGNVILHINIKYSENLDYKSLFKKIEKLSGVLDILN